MRFKIKKSWYISRRKVLKGLGVTCALPYLEAMGESGKNNSIKVKRAAFIFFPNGCSHPPKDNKAYKDWRWHPHGKGKEYIASSVLKPLDLLRDDHTVLSGLSHPKSRSLLGHAAGDTWLTAGDIRGNYNNSISLDQIIAEKYGRLTRQSFLALSCDGGVGYKSRTSTLSFDNNGRALPTQHKPRQIFNNLFGIQNTTKDARKVNINRTRKLVDLILGEAKSLNKILGKNDQVKLEEYLYSVSDIEDRLDRSEKWLDIPLKPVDATTLNLEAKINFDPKAYIRTMYDLMVLAYQMDMTRVITYMLAREDGLGIGDKVPIHALGLKQGHHKIQHNKNKGSYEIWGYVDQWYSQQFAYFLNKMKNTEDENGSLLDSTMILYGSCQSNTHNARNYPLILAGAKKMGLKHNRCLRYNEDTSLSNIFLAMLNVIGIDKKSFADSHGASLLSDLTTV